MSDASSLIEQHIASKKRLRLVRLAGPLALVLVVVFSIWNLISLFTDINYETLTQSFQEEAKRVVPKVHEQLLGSVERLKPTVTEEFRKYQGQVADKLGGKFDAEMNQLKTSVTTRLGTNLAEGLAKSRDRQRAALVKEFPELQDDTDAQNQVLVAAERGAQEWASEQLATELNGHVVALNQIRETLNSKFGEGSDGAGEPPEAVVMTYLEIFADRMSGQDSIIVPEEQVEKEGQQANPTEGSEGGDQ